MLLLALALLGRVPVPASTPAPDTVRVVTDEMRAGWRLYHIHCFRCHGFDANGGEAPNLQLSTRALITLPLFIMTVQEGRPERGMPTWKEFVSVDETKLIYAYIRARDEGLPPGKPVVTDPASR